MSREIESILCLCFGNTCRSPMMQTILSNELTKLHLDGIVVESAGANKDSAGQAIAPFSAQELRKRGLNNDNHVSRFVGDIGDLSRFDLVIAVGENEAATLRTLVPAIADRIEVISIFNPWDEKTKEAYRRCAAQIESEMAMVADRILAGGEYAC